MAIPNGMASQGWCSEVDVSKEWQRCTCVASVHVCAGMKADVGLAYGKCLSRKWTRPIHHPLTLTFISAEECRRDGVS